MEYRIVAVAAGIFHSLALFKSGEVYGWGENESGQVGDGTTKDRNQPQLIEGFPSKVMSIAAGSFHSLAITENGEVYGWGDNGCGQVGDGTRQKKVCPQLIKGIQGKVAGIAAGGYHSLVFLDSGKVYGWGWNEYGQMEDETTGVTSRPKLIKDIPGKVVGIAAGYQHSLVLLESGKVYGWGRNEEGELGDGTTQERRHPQLITGIPGKVIGISAGNYHSLALLESGEVYGWGSNENGQIGGGNLMVRKYPEAISGIPGKALSIASGDYHSLVEIENGVVYGWGDNSFWQLGDSISQNRTHPQLITGIPHKVVGLAAGTYHSLALLENGEVYGWGILGLGKLEIVPDKLDRCNSLRVCPTR